MRRILVKLQNFIEEERLVILPVLFTVTVVMGSWVNSAVMNVDKLGSNLRIVSLELARSQDMAKDVTKTWNKENGKTTAAIKSIKRDYYFIPAYCLFIMFLILLKNYRNRRSDAGKRYVVPKLFLLLIPIAGILDVVENLGMCAYLKDDQVYFLWFFLPAALKFALLLTTLAFLLRPYRPKLDYLARTIKTFRTYFFGIASVAIIYFILIKLTPGQDVAIQIGEWTGPFIATVLCTLLWSGINWYSSRIVGYVKMLHPINSARPFSNEHVPRLIAFNAIVSIQAAILALPTIAWFDEVQLWSFVVLQNMIYFIWSSVLTSKEYRVAYCIILGVFLAAYVSEVIFLLQRKDLVQHQRNLPAIALGFYFLEFGVIALFIGRRRIINKRKLEPQQNSNDTLYLTLFNINVLKVSDSIHRDEQRSFVIFNIFATVGVMVYLLAFILGIADYMGALAVVLISFAMLVGLANILTVVSIKTRSNVFFYIFVLAVVIGRCDDPYEVRIEKTEHPGFYANRPALKDYFTGWLAHRSALISKYNENNKNFPVYLVIADGGASRSGYWVSSVLSALEDETIKKDPSDRFSDHLLCLGGASGGSVGNATFYALLAKQQPQLLDKTRKFLKQDLLSPIIMRWLGSDVLQHFVPFLGIEDRAAILESAMERFGETPLKNAFAEQYSSMADTTGKLPILFLNVTNVQQGVPGIISPVQLDDFSKRLDVLDSVRKEWMDTTSGDIRYSTAVVLGARFPYVSPGGSIGNEFYADGGYFDNTGAGIVHEMMQQIDSLVYPKCDTASMLPKLEFRLIYLSNYSIEQKEDAPIHPLLNDAATPVLTVLGTYAIQTNVNNQRLISFIRKRPSKFNFTEINLYTRKDLVDYPMNWVISDYNLDRMDSRLDSLMTEEIFKNIVNYTQQ